LLYVIYSAIINQCLVWTPAGGASECPHELPRGPSIAMQYGGGSDLAKKESWRFKVVEIK